MRSIQNWKISDTDAVAFTGTGIPDTIQVVNDAKFHTLTDTKEELRDEGATTKIADATPGNCITVFAGETLYGNFTAIKLHSGYVIAHRTIGD